MNKTMKAILCALLAALLCTGLLACAKTPEKDTQNSDSGSGSASGAQSESDAVAMPQSAVALLEKVWASYGENEKFEAVGGDMSEANMKEDASGVFSTEDTDALDQTLGYPASAVSYIDGAASLVHMLNANTFTCGAFHLKSVDNSAAAAKAVRENLAQRHWMCGFPEKLVQIQCGEYLVCFFGDGELCDTFRAKLEAAYPDAAFLSETPIE